jgi:5S rRNA maturation endonuclease (ribonuclease M5)
MNAQRETPPACAASEGLRTKTLSPDDTPSPRDAQGRSPSRSLDPPNGRVRPEALDRARNYPIAELWQRLGLGEVVSGRNVPSPWRDETHASVQVGGAKNIVTDYGTGETLDAIELMRRHMGGDASFADAVAAVLERPVADVLDTDADGMRDAVERLASVRGWKADAMRRLGATAEGHEVRLPMRDGGGEIVGMRRRRGDGKPFKTDGGEQKALTKYGGHGGIMSPWPLPPDGPVLILEGEADACAAVSAGWDAVCATPGASVSARVAEALGAIVAGRDCVLCPDPDPAGEKWRSRVSQVLHRGGCTVRVAALPDGDLDDALKAHPKEERAAALRRLVAEAKAEAETEPADLVNDSPRSRGGGNEQADALIRIGRRADLFHDRDRAGWASFEVEGHRETHAISSHTFRLWLRRQFYGRRGRRRRRRRRNPRTRALIYRAEISTE